MKVIILCKRSPQARDLWLRPYGRFYHLAKFLAENGVDVHFLLLSFAKADEFSTYRDGIHWHSLNLWPNPLRYYHYARKLLATMEFNWIISFSDTYFGICAEKLGRVSGGRVLIDAYDNYESYLSWCYPLHALWRRALRRSSVITAAGPELLSLMTSGRRDTRSAIIEMAADPAFSPGSKRLARESLGLPVDKLLVTYSGSLHRSRGIDELFQVMGLLLEKRPDICWVLSGRLEPGLQLPVNCCYLGYVDDDKVADVLRASDLMLCANKPGAFGDYSYPVKIYEALAVGIPVVAFSTPSVRYVMRDNTDGLVPIGDPAAVADKIAELLARPYVVNAPATGWDMQGKSLYRLLSQGACS
jgi:glycosyltransferase involved in cell wall biosynthesis